MRVHFTALNNALSNVGTDVRGLCPCVRLVCKLNGRRQTTNRGCWGGRHRWIYTKSRPLGLSACLLHGQGTENYEYGVVVVW